MAPFRRPLDSYLLWVKERIIEARDYLKGRKPFLGITISLLFDTLSLTLQRIVIDRKGISIIDQMRKEKKIYFDTFVGIFRQESVKLEKLNIVENCKSLIFIQKINKEL